MSGKTSTIITAAFCNTKVAPQNTAQESVALLILTRRTAHQCQYSQSASTNSTSPSKKTPLSRICGSNPMTHQHLLKAITALHSKKKTNFYSLNPNTG
ncbi:hypothetical protein KC19_4G146300 [Ceratodon purpureus]|uniref:Uncharacterized protein n=1 Tax=Ceratodon purpureus TaxID=3225 RepID=A0A8T0IC76_CERPU|nr:hypothetical protein KC19_4G146300 [Ceratodon purpureus]